MSVHDVLVVGSGISGAMASQTLVESGKKVIMLDVGQQPKPEPLIPNTDFLTLRYTDRQQRRYFIGRNLEGVGWGKVGKGEQLTPPRKHMEQLADQLLPVVSSTFLPVESLGYGGLGIGWGIGCWEWSAAELQAAGLSSKNMRLAYQLVSERIGISATRDNASDYTIGTLHGFQPSADMDANHQKIYQRYQQSASHFKNKGFFIGRAPLALITKDVGKRKKYSYKDMDFYSDQEQSAYRPWITINELRTRANFTYINDQLVVSFKEEKDTITVSCLDIKTNKLRSFKTKKLVLASGILGTARIVLRSLGNDKIKLPLLCNPYSYVPCLIPGRLGKEAERHKLGFAQLSAFIDEDGANVNASMASLYSYQSLMLFRMVRQVPLSFSDARLLLQYLTSGMVIMGIHHPDSPSPSKYLSLQPSQAGPTKDSLHISYTPTAQDKRFRNNREKQYISFMRSLGVYALKRIDPGFGSSIHYAGTLPFSKTSEPFRLSAQGRLHGTRNVHVADGSGFTYLPAKGLTFSLMANAHLSALEALTQ